MNSCVSSLVLFCVLLFGSSLFVATDAKVFRSVSVPANGHVSLVATNEFTANATFRVLFRAESFEMAQGVEQGSISVAMVGLYTFFDKVGRNFNVTSGTDIAALTFNATFDPCYQHSLTIPGGMRTVNISSSGLNSLNISLWIEFEPLPVDLFVPQTFDLSCFEGQGQCDRFFRFVVPESLWPGDILVQLSGNALLNKVVFGNTNPGKGNCPYGGGFLQILDQYGLPLTGHNETVVDAGPGPYYRETVGLWTAYIRPSTFAPSAESSVVLTMFVVPPEVPAPQNPPPPVQYGDIPTSADTPGADNFALAPWAIGVISAGGVLTAVLIGVLVWRITKPTSYETIA